MERKYIVRVNSSEKIEELLQEIYDQACKHLKEIEIEMSKLINNTNLGDDNITMDDKAKYSKAMHDFFSDKSKAIAAKFEIAKFLGELIKHNGDINATLNDEKVRKSSKLDIKGLKEAIVSEINADKDTPPKTYILK